MTILWPNNLLIVNGEIALVASSYNYLVQNLARTFLVRKMYFMKIKSSSIHSELWLSSGTCEVPLSVLLWDVLVRVGALSLQPDQHLPPHPGVPETLPGHRLVHRLHFLFLFRFDFNKCRFIELSFCPDFSAQAWSRKTLRFWMGMLKRKEMRWRPPLHLAHQGWRLTWLLSSWKACGGWWGSWSRCPHIRSVCLQEYITLLPCCRTYGSELMHIVIYTSGFGNRYSVVLAGDVSKTVWVYVRNVMYLELFQIRFCLWKT